MKGFSSFFRDHWFLLGLVLLGLAAIPGVVLVVCALLGVDGAINEWLRDNFNLTYQLTLPAWLSTLLLLLPVALIVLYLLRLRRKALQVPSTYLWKKSIEDLHVNALLQWLRNNVLLLLQLLALLFLIYSVLGLRIHGSTSSTKHYILMIDNSASMSAKDVDPSRLEWAKQQALKEIEAAHDSDFGMVLVFNSKATTLQGYTNDRGKLREAVRGIEPTQRQTRIEEALALAESLANPVRSTEDAASQPDEVRADQQRTFVTTRGISTTVHLYSDGRYQKLTEATLAGLNARMAGNFGGLGNLDLRYHCAGKLPKDGSVGHANNVGIVGLNALRYANPKAKAANFDVARLQVLVRVQNFRNVPAEARLRLDVYVDGKLTHPEQRFLNLKERKVTPAPEGVEEDAKDEPGEATLTFLLPPLDARRNVVLHAVLDKMTDDFPLDDQAWLVVGAVRKAKVLLVEPDKSPNVVLDAFFDQEGTKRFSSLEKMAASELKGDGYRRKARGTDYDFVIFDRCAPDDEADMPLASTFFIDRPPPPWQRGVASLKNPLLMPSKQNQSWLRYLTTLWDVRVGEAWVFDPQKNLDPKVAELVQLPEGDAKRRVLPPVTRIVETTSHTPLLLSMPRGAYTDLVLTFALMDDAGGLNTDWPLQPSFPLFLRNVLYILGNVDDAVRTATVAPGEPMLLRPEAGVTGLEVTGPGRKVAKLQRGNRPDFVFADTEQAGVYHFQVEPKDGLARSFAVNLLDSNESNIEPRAEIRIGSEKITTGAERAQPREIWKWILLLVVLLLSVEWHLYNRRISI